MPSGNPKDMSIKIAIGISVYLPSSEPRTERPPMMANGFPVETPAIRSLLNDVVCWYIVICDLDMLVYEDREGGRIIIANQASDNRILSEVGLP